MICTSKKQAHALVKSGKDCQLVIKTASLDLPVVGGEKAVFWFANYTQKNGKIGWTSQAKAHQLCVG